MINIVEDTPSKISGLTSLFVSFDYNPEIVNIIKNASKYSFDKTTYFWELPITCLSYLLDNLTYIDDITLKLKNDVDNKNHFYPKLVAKYKSKPFKHQLEGIEFGLNTDKWLLLDEPGLGKTLQMIYLAEELKAQKGLEHCLIICGINALKANWEEEIHKHSNESVRILGKKISKNGKVSYSTIKERAAEIMRPMESFFIIVNIESIRNDDVIQALKTTKNKIDMIVLDEAHRCLAGNTLIETDEGLKSIAEIVENKLDCKVKSFNLKENKIEFKSIDDYYKSDFEENVIELTILDEKNIPHSIICTEDHPVYTKNRGYVLAKDLDENDELFIM